MRNCFVLLVLLSLVACMGPQDISNSNLSSFYRSSDRLFHPAIEVYQHRPDSARLFVRFNTRELLYVNQGHDQFTASLKIVCRLLESYEMPTAYDTVEKIFTLPRQPDEFSTKVLTLDLPVPKSQVYLLEITLADTRKNTSDQFFLELDASSVQSRNTFFVNRPGTVVPLFQDYLQPTDTVCVTYRDSAVKYLTVKFYHRDFPLAAPPYSFDINNPFNYRTDSLFKIRSGATLTLHREGFYMFLVDSSVNEGLTLFRFTKGFPSVTQPATMIDAVRFLTSKREFEDLKASADQKTAIDKFWINVGNNQERTRMLIKKYYGRVQEANRLFTSYTEGWRTDRGMIYTVMGIPHIVYRSSVSESWVYGQAGSPISISFSFTKVRNPFTNNDFTLSRAPVYESHWHQAVDVWRQGRVYNDSN